MITLSTPIGHLERCVSSWHDSHHSYIKFSSDILKRATPSYSIQTSPNPRAARTTRERRHRYSAPPPDAISRYPRHRDETRAVGSSRLGARNLPRLVFFYRPSRTSYRLSAVSCQQEYESACRRPTTRPSQLAPHRSQQTPRSGHPMRFVIRLASRIKHPAS
jgi:hypothetical protein